MQNEGNPDGVFADEDDESEKKGNLEPKRVALGRREQWVVVVLRKETRDESLTLPFKAFAIFKP